MAPPKTRILRVSKDEDGDRMVRGTNKSCYSTSEYTTIEMRVDKVLKAANKDTCSWGIYLVTLNLLVHLGICDSSLAWWSMKRLGGLIIDLHIKKAATGLMSRNRQEACEYGNW